MLSLGRFFQMLFCILMLSACTDGVVENSVENGRGAGIVDGKKAYESSLIYKSAVYIKIKSSGDRFFVCTGSVLSSTVILTAGHCVTDRQDPAKKYVVAAKNINVDEIAAQEIIVNPVYLKNLQQDTMMVNLGPGYDGRDLALVKLSQPLSSEEYQAVEIVRNFSSLSLESISIAGYGKHSLNAENPVDGILRQGKITMDLKAKSQSVYTLENSKSEWTSGYPTNSPFARVMQFKKDKSSAGVCHGDSGGPLYFEKDGKIHQIGVNVSIASVKELPCAATNELEYATLLANENLQFVADAFLKLTQQKLPGAAPLSPAADPLQFPFYFGRTETPHANKWLNLEGLAIEATFAKNPKSQTFLVPQGALMNCSSLPKENLVLLDDQYAYSAGQGTTSMVVRSLEFNADRLLLPKWNIEVHVKNSAEQIEIVALTPDGFIANKIPKIHCHYDYPISEMLL
jgi:secreted trypsin-like serine protease